MNSTKSVLIVGGGPSGVMTAKALMKQQHSKKDLSFTVTIVDRQNYCDWSLASPRSVVRPQDVEKFGYCFPLDKVCEFAGCSFRQGAVAKIGENSVTLEDGTVINADAIVVAIGGQYACGALWKPLPDQTTVERRIAAFEAENAKINEASDIVIIGAGATGVEVAGEIKSAFPDKNVTLVGTVLSNATEYMRTKVKRTLENMGVIFKDGRVEAAAPEDGKVVTTKGEAINCDLLLNTAGFVYEGRTLADGSIEESVTKRGQFKCKPTLQLSTCDTVFAVGDVLEVPEGKYADVKGMQHADDNVGIVGSMVQCPFRLLLHRLLLQIIKSEIFVARLRWMLVLLCGIDIRKADESAPRKRRSFCYVMKKRPANFRGGPVHGWIRSVATFCSRRVEVGEGDSLTRIRRV